MRYSYVFLGCLALTWSVPVQGQGQGPFGVAMGTPISNYSSCKKHPEQVGWYACSSLPKSHASFEIYYIQATPKIGVCFVKAIGKDINRDPRGVRTRAEVERLAAQIAQTYGPQTAIRDTLSPRSSLKAPDEWLAGVNEDERAYSYDWTKGNYANDLESIHVFARATDGQTGYATAEFYFKNEKQCDTELDKEAF
jgi:hypothetical protein